MPLCIISGREVVSSTILRPEEEERRPSFGFQVVDDGIATERDCC